MLDQCFGFLRFILLDFSDCWISAFGFLLFNGIYGPSGLLLLQISELFAGSALWVSPLYFTWLFWFLYQCFLDFSALFYFPFLSLSPPFLFFSAHSFFFQYLSSSFFFFLLEKREERQTMGEDWRLSFPLKKPIDI